ncbi:hypothetical protein, partial [Burkholderia territorii]
PAGPTDGPTERRRLTLPLALKTGTVHLDLRTQLGLLQGKCDLLFRKLARLHGMAFVSAWTHHAEFLYFCTGLFLGSGSGVLNRMAELAHLQSGRIA